MHASIGSRTVNGRACGVVRCHFLTRGVFCSLTLSRSLAVADFLACRPLSVSLSPGTTSVR